MRFLYCSKRKDAVQTTKKICKIYKADAIALPAIEKWFAKFEAGNFDFKNAEDQSKDLGRIGRR